MKIKVLDENNEPVSGAKVISTLGDDAFFTDFDGESEIDPSSNTTVTVEFVGYEPQEVSISTQGEEVIVILQKRVPSKAL